MTIDVIEIRRADANDADVLAPLWLENMEAMALLDARWRIAPDGAARWAAAFTQQVNRQDRIVFVAMRRGRAAGYLVGGIQSNVPGLLPEQLGVVLELCVDSHGHGGGAGTKLWTAFSGWLRERTITRVEVRAPVGNAIAQAFWRAIGAAEWYDSLWIKLRE